MSEYYSEPQYSVNYTDKKKKFRNKYLLHILLFAATFITTTVAGMQWIIGSGGPYPIEMLKIGLPYSVSILFILTCHEFGHYFAAKFHKVEATLPYYIPLPPFSFFLNFGTMGAVIKTKSPVQSNKVMFDIGVTGPIAGFIASLVVIIYGFTHLPGIDYLLKIHPNYFAPDYGVGALNLKFGDTILFSFIKSLFTVQGQFIPPMSEIYHYPYLCVGWFGLFVTAMNMIPIGQLDGGHIVYSMLGTIKHTWIAQFCMGILVILGLMGIGETTLNWGIGIGWTGWLFWAIILYFIIKVKHPPVAEFEPLGWGRMIIGYISLFILIISFSPSPINLAL